MKIIFGSLISLFFFSGAVSAIEKSAQESCEAKKSYLTFQMTNAESVEGLTDSLLKVSKAVLLIGEEHGQDYGPEKFSRFLPIVKRHAPSINCMALENFGPEHVKMFREFNAGKDQLLDAASDVSPAQRSSFRYLRTNGFKVLPVDDNNNPNYNPDVIGIDSWVNYRNQFISSTMDNLIKDGTCSGIVLYIGLLHLTTWSPLKHPTLDDRLSALGVSSHKLLSLTPPLVDDPEAAWISPTWIWSKRPLFFEQEKVGVQMEDLICSDVPRVPSAPIAFRRSSTLDSVIGVDPFATNLQFFGKFSDFEGVLIFPPVKGTLPANRSELLYKELSALGVREY